MKNFGVADKEHYGMLWYFLEWSIGRNEVLLPKNHNFNKICDLLGPFSKTKIP